MLTMEQKNLFWNWWGERYSIADLGIVEKTEEMERSEAWFEGLLEKLEIEKLRERIKELEEIIKNLGEDVDALGRDCSGMDEALAKIQDICGESRY